MRINLPTMLRNKEIKNVSKILCVRAWVYEVSRVNEQDEQRECDKNTTLTPILLGHPDAGDY